MYSINGAGDFAFPDLYGQLIIHSFDVSQTPLSLSLKVTPLGRRVRFVPYFGGGVSLNLWTVRLKGDIVDFSDPWIYTDPEFGDIYVYPVYYSLLEESNRVTLGYNAFAGVMVPIGNRMTLDLGIRYNFLKVKFRDSFEGFEDFDLNGYSLNAGLNFWF
jgi:opacity protein-like surface antigen